MVTTPFAASSREWVAVLRRLHWPGVALLGAVCLALALRLTGIGAGLPAALFSDEAYLIDNSLPLSWSDLNPHTFVWGSLSFYLVRIVDSALEMGARLFAGRIPSYSEYALAARLLSTAANIGTLLLIYTIARRLAGRGAGIAAAWLFAIAPSAVQYSHFASIETLLLFWTTLAIFGIVLWNGGNPRGRELAAVAAGLAMATKYSALLILLPIVFSGFIMARRETGALSQKRRLLVIGAAAAFSLGLAGVWLGREPLLRLLATWTNTGTLKDIYVQLFNRVVAALLLPLAAAWTLVLGQARQWRWAVGTGRILTSKSLLTPLLLAGVVFLLAEPFAALDFPAFAQGAGYDLVHQEVGSAIGFSDSARSFEAATSQAVARNYLYYVQAIGDEWGPLFVAFIILGIWFAFRRKPIEVTGLAAWLLVTLAIVSLGRNPGFRYVFPVWGLLAVFGGAGIAAIATGVGIMARRRPKFANHATTMGMQAIAAIVLIAALSFTPLKTSSNLLNTLFMRDDTRNLAYAWIAGHIPPGAHILRESELTTTVDTPSIERLTNAYHVQVEAYLFEKASLAVWRAQGIEYIIVGESRRRFYQSHEAQFRDVLAQYDVLSSGMPTMTFLPSDRVQGPPIYIYELK